MGPISIDDIIITPLQRIQVIGGDVMHAMKKLDQGYVGFGEAYFSWVQHQYVKAWKLHTKMTLNLVVPVGEIRLVFVSPDNPLRFRTENIGTNNYSRITVPPGLWFGFQGIAEQDSLLLNMANIVHEPDETQRKEITSFSYNWTEPRP